MFKKDIIKRLNLLKENKVDSIKKTYNPYTVNCSFGYMLISPFGRDTYSYDIVFNSKLLMEEFLKRLNEFEILSSVSANIKCDNVNKQYVIEGFIHSSLIEDLTLIVKEILR